MISMAQLQDNISKTRRKGVSLPSIINILWLNFSMMCYLPADLCQ